MKRIILFFLVVLLALVTTASAQNKPRAKAAKQYTVTKKKPAKKTNNKANTTESRQETVTLNSVSASEAYGSVSRYFTIADPTINALNMQANGSDIKISSSGIAGMPKLAYGLANGKILLRNTTATSSGTIYGSGAVGTGTTIAGIGTSENAIGVNGKNPYAGPWLWGSKQPVHNVPLKTTNNKQSTNNRQ